MQSYSETRTVDGARVEVGTVIHAGQTFSALGSVVDESRGQIVGYVCRREGRWLLTTWSGEPIMVIDQTSAYRGLRGADVRCWSGLLNGSRYSGRNGGEGLVCTMRARKS